MDKFPLLWKEKVVGELTAEQEALYTCFVVRGILPEEGLWCAWAVGDRGELRLGVLEPQGDEAVIRRRLSHRTTAPAGRLLQGEVRPASRPAPDWVPVSDAAELFRSDDLRQRLQDVPGLLLRRKGKMLVLAVPYDPQKPLPLVSYICFAQPQQIGNELYLVFVFDENRHPVL